MLRLAQLSDMSRRLELIAHDIRSAQNVGALLRMADSVGVAKLWLTGYTPTPDHAGVAKTALGAQSSVPWEQKRDVLQLLAELRQQGFRIVGLELDPRATDLVTYRAPDKVALLLGNEVDGIAPSLREACDDLMMMSQKGSKESMNVSNAASIASYWILNHHI